MKKIPLLPLLCIISCIDLVVFLVVWKILDLGTTDWIILIPFLVLPFGIGIACAIMFRKQKIKAHLLKNGITLDATISEIRENTSIRIAGKHPWNIHAQYKDSNGKVYSYESENLWVDPSPYLKKDILVYVNPMDYSIYHMDTSFLPDSVR